MYIKLKISTISSTSISPANIADKYSLYLHTNCKVESLFTAISGSLTHCFIASFGNLQRTTYTTYITIYTLHIQLDILTGPILVVHPEGPAQLLLRVSAARHVGRDHELLEVDAAVPVLVENTEQLLQKLVSSLALCR